MGLTGLPYDARTDPGRGDHTALRRARLGAGLAAFALTASVATLAVAGAAHEGGGPLQHERETGTSSGLPAEPGRSISVVLAALHNDGIADATVERMELAGVRGRGARPRFFVATGRDRFREGVAGGVDHDSRRRSSGRRRCARRAASSCRRPPPRPPARGRPSSWWPIPRVAAGA